MSFALQGLGYRCRATRIGLGMLSAFARVKGQFGTMPRPFRPVALFPGRQPNPGPARLGKSNGNGLFGRARSMFAFADIFNGLAHEFTGLGAGRLAFSFILTSPFDGFFLRHGRSPFPETPRNSAWPTPER